MSARTWRRRRFKRDHPLYIFTFHVGDRVTVRHRIRPVDRARHRRTGLWPR